MSDLSNMSDEQVHREWSDTKMRAASLQPGVEPPAYTPAMAARHDVAEAELKTRGFVEQSPGWWVGPDGRTF